MRDRTLEPNPAILCSQPLSKSHEMTCICHAYVMHMSCICHAYVMQCSYQIRFQTQFRSQRRCNNRLCGDAEPCSNLQQMCDSQQQHVHNIFTTSSQHVPTSYKRKRQTETSCRSCRVSQHALHWRSTCWWPTWHQQAIQANRSSLLAWGTHLRRQEILDNIWAIFGQL